MIKNNFELLNIRFPFLILAFLLTLSLSSCSNNQAVTPEAQHNTKVWILENNPQLEHPLISKLFESLLSRLALGYSNINRTMPNTKVYLIENEKVGVFSICDGTIFISSGTINSLNSAHELIAMLAHDVAHISLNHACTHTTDQKTLLEYEIDSDKLAIRTLLATYIDPSKLKQVYLNVYRKSESDDARYQGIVDSERLSKLESNLSYLNKEIETKIPEERLFRKVKALLKQ